MPPTALDLRLAAVRLHQLEGFYHVATHEGFTRAADAMPYPITEPALHQQVRKLERALGVRLLVRGPKRRMMLTPEGRSVYGFVAPYFQRLPGVLRDLATGAAGTLIVAAEPLYVAEGLCADALCDVARRCPGAGLRLVERELPEIVRGLERGDVDVGVAGGVTDLPAGLVHEEVGSLGLKLLVPAGHALAARRPPLRAAWLSGHRYVVYERGTWGRAYTDRLLRQVGIEVAAAAESSTAAGMRALARSGLAPALVPALAGGPRARGGRGAPHASDGLVTFDLGHLLQAVAGVPPRFGLLRRTDPGLAGAPGAPRGSPGEGLVAAFAAAARAWARPSPPRRRRT